MFFFLYCIPVTHPWAGIALTPSVSALDSKPITNSRFSHLYVCMRIGEPFKQTIIGPRPITLVVSNSVGYKTGTSKEGNA